MGVLDLFEQPFFAKNGELVYKAGPILLWSPFFRVRLLVMRGARVYILCSFFGVTG